MALWLQTLGRCVGLRLVPSLGRADMAAELSLVRHLKHGVPDAGFQYSVSPVSFLDFLCGVPIVPSRRQQSQSLLSC